jgi:hypothetical protein
MAIQNSYHLTFRQQISDSSAVIRRHLSCATSSRNGDGYFLLKVYSYLFCFFHVSLFCVYLYAEYDAAMQQAGAVELDVQNLHKQIMTITSGRMKAAQKRVDDISKNLDKVRQEVTKLKVAIRTSERFVLLQVKYLVRHNQLIE